ncbi:hypothetical protein [Streptomyces massasporeus]|uniref:hypothetical protein n=1 Tax=Streptomyces massasporeus TaxID=67324 RepID=UPI0016757DF6|nr:hypothetical protein [Streptomyces massasporeus]GGV91856.1 hypothetical protein GCM10010228_83110 [Streptomyces massasporeus]
MNLAWIVPAVLVPGAVMAVVTVWRERRHLPAAPDNLPPADIDAFITCRRIAALPVASREEKP